MIILKDNGDGTYLGADETGKLYDGTIVQHGFDEITRSVVNKTSKQITYEDKIGDNIIGSGDVEVTNYTEGPQEKVFVDTHDENGNVTGQVEKKLSTIDWAAK